LETACPIAEMIQVKPLTSGTLFRYAKYIYKAEKEHASKRMLFKPHLGLDKHGFVGKFWVQSKATLWKEIQVKEAAISKASRLPAIIEQSNELFLLVDPSMTHKQVLRRLATQFIETQRSQDILNVGTPTFGQKGEANCC